MLVKNCWIVFLFSWFISILWSCCRLIALWPNHFHLTRFGDCLSFDHFLFSVIAFIFLIIIFILFLIIFTCIFLIIYVFNLIFLSPLINAAQLCLIEWQFQCIYYGFSLESNQINLCELNFILVCKQQNLNKGRNFEKKWGLCCD